jgi:hypothetical protein
MISSVQPPTAPPKKKAYCSQCQRLSGIAIHHAGEGLIPRFNFKL